MKGGKFKKWEESSARVIKCDEASVHRKDEFVGHETNISDYVNPDRQLSGLDGNPKCGCEKKVVVYDRYVVAAAGGGGGRVCASLGSNAGSLLLCRPLSDGWEMTTTLPPYF